MILPPKMAFFVAVLLASIHSGLCRNLLPERWLENIPTADGSTQACLVFKTIPGVEYRVESSPDLIQWTTENELYGLGHEFVTPMREFIPTPPPLPGDPPAAPVTFPTTNVPVAESIQRRRRRNRGFLAIFGRPWATRLGYHRQSRSELEPSPPLCPVLRQFQLFHHISGNTHRSPYHSNDSGVT